MKTIFIDYETYYDNTYSLRKLTPVEYVLDPRFECIGAAIKEEINGESYWVDGDDLHLFFADQNPAQTLFVSHNALFDMCINAWRYNFVPYAMADTLGMARAMLGYKLKSLSLANVALHYGLGVKGDTVHKVIGMGAAAIKQAGLFDSYIQYAINDVELCAAIYDRLLKDGFPARELVVNDMVLRCAIQPQFQLQQTVLSEHLNTIKSSKDALLQKVGPTKEDLMSNEKFAEALRSLGVAPPMKVSLATGLETFAFAKTDAEFIELEEHESPDVQALVAARIGHKSTLEETRTGRFLTISHLQWPQEPQRRMPMPLRYSGAHTHRLSGDWKLNVQNMPRGGAIRRALIAPPGHQIMTADSSQIEARMVAWICGQETLVKQFAAGVNVYSAFASKIFERPITKADKAERFLGKTCILGMGYGVGWEKFQKTVFLQSKAQSGSQIDLSPEDAQRIVRLFRTEFDQIPLMWKRLNQAINVLGMGGAFAIGPCAFAKGEVKLPSGLSLKYHNLQHLEGNWHYDYGPKLGKKLYGGALLENIVQALARIVVMDAAVSMRHVLAVYDIQLALQVHDELVYVVPDDLVEVCRKILLDAMRTPPTWAPTLPLDAEVGVGRSYGEAK